MTIIDAIGNTPLVEIKNIWNSASTGVRILAKLEGSNPSGSIKDRAVRSMLLSAIKDGKITNDSTILEPTSGNTGIGLAMLSSSLGFKVKLVMPACVSQERRTVLLAYGAELELTPGSEKTDGAIRRAHYILEKHPDKYFMPNQYDNPANWLAHYETTGPEIVRDTNGSADWFVAGMGTSGTLMGCSRYFREKAPQIKVAGIEPTLNHRIQGLKNMNESIVPAIYDPSLLDSKILCEDEEAFELARELAEGEGIFCGISSGAAYKGAITIARDLPRGSTVVVLFPDRGDRYLSTELFRSVCADCPP